jgi:hypothetical protein
MKAKNISCAQTQSSEDSTLIIIAKPLKIWFGTGIQHCSIDMKF